MLSWLPYVNPLTCKVIVIEKHLKKRILTVYEYREWNRNTFSI